jgi:ATP-binding cassette subfamily B multidrug efflux pump
VTTGTARTPAGRIRPPRFWTQVAALVRPWRRMLVLAIGCVVGAALAGVVPPLVVRHVVDRNLLAHRTAGLPAAAVVYLGAVVAGAALAYAYSYLSAIVAQRAILALRVRLFGHLARLPVSYLDHTPLGDIISRATSDVETIDVLFTDGIATLVGQLASLIAVAIAMVAISPLLSAISLVVVPPLAVSSRWLQVRVRDAERNMRRAVGGLNTQLSETVGGSETIRAFGREAAFVMRFRAMINRTLLAQERSVRYSALFTPVTGLLSSAAIAALLWVGAGGLFRSTDVELGTLVAFVLLFQGFFAPIVALGDQWNAVQAAIAGAERVFAVLNVAADAVPEPEPAAARDAGIEVRGVSYGYPNGTPVLRDVSLTVRPGEQVAVVGRTGAGKSTLLGLLGGLYGPSAGEILLAGRDPRSLREDERRSKVGVVPQHVQLFAGSMRENLTLGDRLIGDDAISRAVSLAGMQPVLAAMPEGLDTILAGSGGGRGAVLSAGQRQLVALARALVAGPQVLLLDEATAAVDATSDAAFCVALTRTARAQGCAVLTVAHRISTARDADRVLVMEGGRIVEQGPPADLIDAGGRFAALAALDEAGWDWSDTPADERSDIDEHPSALPPSQPTR